MNAKDKMYAKDKLYTADSGIKPALTFGLAALLILGGAYFFVIKKGSQNDNPPQSTAPYQGQDPYADAQKLDALSYHYFSTGDYERAIPLLEFGVKTYKENGTKLGNGGEDTYLADNLQHIGKCYLMLKKPEKAVTYYEDSLKIYKKFGNYRGGQMPEAINDFAKVLRELGRSGEADAMVAEFEKTGNVASIP